MTVFNRFAAMLLSVSMLGSAVTVMASEPEETAKPNNSSSVAIFTEINGEGVYSIYNGSDFVVDTYSVGKALNNIFTKPTTPAPEETTLPSASPEASTEPEVTALPVATPEPEATVSPEVSQFNEQMKSALYNTYFFQLIREYIDMCIAERFGCDPLPSPEPKGENVK